MITRFDDGSEHRHIQKETESDGISDGDERREADANFADCDTDDDGGGDDGGSFGCLISSLSAE